MVTSLQLTAQLKRFLCGMPSKIEKKRSQNKKYYKLSLQASENYAANSNSDVKKCAVL